MPVDQTIRKIIAAGCFLSLAAGCITTTGEFAGGVPCEAEGFIVEDQFNGARRGDCEVFSDGHVRVNIAPEDEGWINNSPWYAFRLVPKVPGTATVNIRYHNGDHRYWPKWSSDGSRWQLLSRSRVETRRSGISFTVELQDEPVLIAAQELYLPQNMAGWSERIDATSDARRSVLGQSQGGEAIYRLDINREASEVVFLAGRQHPPEITGAIGFLAFYEAILADNEIANAFRARFHTVAIPMLNPDGVKAGHWRHNLNGTDLNRDWGPFTQPETRLVARLLDELDDKDKRVRVSVDFHSTKDNLIYRQEDGVTMDPEAFSQRWIAASLARLPGYAFRDEPRPTSELATSRNYMHKRYGIPAVTYEVGDNEDRTVIRQAAAVFAEEFMRLFLETPANAE